MNNRSLAALLAAGAALVHSAAALADGAPACPLFADAGASCVAPYFHGYSCGLCGRWPDNPQGIDAGVIISEWGTGLGCTAFGNGCPGLGPPCAAGARSGDGCQVFNGDCGGFVGTSNVFVTCDNPLLCGICRVGDGGLYCGVQSEDAGYANCPPAGSTGGGATSGAASTSGAGSSSSGGGNGAGSGGSTTGGSSGAGSSGGTGGGLSSTSASATSGSGTSSATTGDLASGCGCQPRGPNPGPWLLALMVPLLLRRRRAA